MTSDERSHIPDDEPLTDKIYWKLSWLPVACKARFNRALYRLGVGAAVMFVTYGTDEFDVYCSACDTELEPSTYYFGPEECPECETSFRTTIHEYGDDHDD